MIKFFSKPYRWAGVFSLLLVGMFTFVLLDAFVIQKSMVIVASETGTETATVVEVEPVVTETSYADEHIEISIETLQEYDSTIYVADIQISDASYLKTAFANSTYGRNVKAKTSDIAAAQNAIFAINGDYYGFRDEGYVLRNGVVYRDSASENEALVIDKTGNFSIVSESEVRMTSLSENWQVLSFGPALVENGTITVDSSSEVGQAKESNPRTAIGQISAGHYLVIVSDGRTDESEGLSLLELAQEFQERGCTVAYNLDGGGSSTMVFNGEVINNPTDGRSIEEREVSDIVYFGY
ncbi:phosphodiester glycosidase family protein [Acetobacterium malicum]|uniref:phosphodiester glycosidase family protein n=1 Tax=Acetobacterium malicum TaxID=52692 RepID=UPI000407EFFE|nr:phosphodiester glycosidase family protein [Acetobacterium dehalogenans]